MSTPDPNECTAAQLLADRIRHSIVFQEAALRAMREALELLTDQTTKEE